MATLSLGKVDAGAMPADPAQFLARYHTSMASLPQAKSQFRDEADGVWRSFQPIDGSEVRALQQFLHDKGFLPKADMIDGIFGYSTQAAVRLFQEYIRTVEKIESIGAPDGAVGPNTLSHVQRWIANGIQCEWNNWASPEYAQWINLLAKAKNHFQTNSSEIADLVNRHPNRGSTRKVDEWDVSADTVHLIGLRQGQENAATARDSKGRFLRGNDDLFIFLIKGMVFKFWGSTDPNPALSRDSGNPFLVEGQHLYQFGWHGLSDEKQHQVYRALKPEKLGVLVYRVPEAAGLTSVGGGLDPAPNPAINIHWSGLGGYNFSAGCQVISGGSYINHRDEVVNCTKHAALSYSELGTKGRGAYNVFTDLLLSYGPPGVRTIAYTLGRDETLRLADEVPAWKDPNFVSNTVRRMKG